MIIKGKLIRCKREEKEVRDKKGKAHKIDEALWITLAEVNLSEKKLDELKEAFKESGDQYTPDWVKNFNGYVNIKTKYELPCRDLQGVEYPSIEVFIKEHAWLSADVSLSLNIKEGAVYPNAIIFESEGKPFNPFAEFDNDEED